MSQQPMKRLKAKDIRDAPGYDGVFYELQGDFVDAADVEAVEADNVAKFLQIRNMISDCNEHCQDQTRTQLENNKLKRAIAAKDGEIEAARTLLRIEKECLLGAEREVDELKQKLEKLVNRIEAYRPASDLEFRLHVQEVIRSYRHD